MDTIVLLDCVSALAFAIALIFALLIPEKTLPRPSRWLLVVVLGIYVLVGISNILEHGGITAAMDVYEDYVEILFLPLFLMFLSSVVMLREISRRKISEEALRTSEGEYRLLVNSIPDVVWMSDRQGETTFISPNVEKVYGYHSEEIRASGADLWFGRIHPKDREKVRSSFEKMFSGESGFDIEYRIKHRNGTWIWLHDRAITNYDREGREYAFGIFSDITDLKLAKEALRESETRQRVLLSALPDMIFRIYKDGTFLDFEGPKSAFPVVPPEEFIGKRISDFFPREIVEKALFHTGEALRTGALQVFEYSLPEGEKTVEYEARLAVSGDDEVLAVVRDVSERKQAEEVLKNAKENLERQYEELKKLDQMKDGLIRDVSHELKTPVAKHAMQLEILKPIIEKHHLTEDESSALLIMEESIRRQESVIRNLLDLSRLEGGGRKYRKDFLHLDEVMAEIKREYGSIIDRCGSELTIDMPPLPIRSDREMLWHLFSNLVNNSIKFRKEGSSGRVTVTAGADDGKVVVKVADDGKGLEENEKARAFDRFYQVSPSIEGSGVGLTICRMIAEGLGGTITIESRGRGKGAVATVTLPVT